MLHIYICGICYIIITNNTNMDSEPSKQKNINPYANVRHVLQPNGVRYSILHDITANKFLCNYYFYFLPIISVMFWSLFLLF